MNDPDAFCESPDLLHAENKSRVNIVIDDLNNFRDFAFIKLMFLFCFAMICEDTNYGEEDTYTSLVEAQATVM